MGLCFALQDVDGLANLPNLTFLYFDQCTSLKNVNGLANCNTLTRLNLKMCGALQNADGLANLSNLISLDLHDSGKVHPKPAKDEMTTREEVAAYQEEIKKSIK